MITWRRMIKTDANGLPVWAMRRQETTRAHRARHFAATGVGRGDATRPATKHRRGSMPGSGTTALRDAPEDELREITGDTTTPAGLLHGPAAAIRLEKDGEKRQRRSRRYSLSHRRLARLGSHRSGTLHGRLSRAGKKILARRSVLSRCAGAAFVRRRSSDRSFASGSTGRCAKAITSSRKPSRSGIVFGEDWEVDSPAPCCRRVRRTSRGDRYRSRATQPKPAVAARRRRCEAPPGMRIKVEVLNATKTKGLARKATTYSCAIAGSTSSRSARRRSSGQRRSFSTGQIIRTWAAACCQGARAQQSRRRPDSSRYLDVTVLVGADWRPPPLPFYP